MMADVERQLQDSDSNNEEIDIFTNVVPNVDAKALGRRLMNSSSRTGRPAPLKSVLLRTRFVFAPAVRLFSRNSATGASGTGHHQRHPTTMMAMMPWRPDSNDEIELEYETAKRSASLRNKALEPIPLFSYCR
jgi:hypothetical protein